MIQMPYYHVYIDRDGDETEETDFSKEQLMRNIVKPFSYHKEFLCRGTIIDPYDVTTIRIVETNEPSSELLQNATRGATLGELFGRVSNFKLLEGKGRDVTREFIKIRAERRRKPLRKKMPTPHTKNVFIVHGRDHETVKELKAMLSDVGLNPVVLQELPSGSMTVIEKLEKYSNDVSFAFAVLSPDDAGCELSRLLTVGRTASVKMQNKEWILVETLMNELKPRTRQNVLLEFGFFIGKLSRLKVCCLYKGNVDLPSDMSGIVYIHFDKSVNEVKDKIVEELKAAGYEIKR